jgi:hypothetical protein
MGVTKKITACLLFAFCFCKQAFSQDVYFVTFVKGDVKKANTKIKVGDKLLSPDKLVFSQKDGRLILLHPQKGRFIVEPGHTDPAPSGEYFVYLKNNLIPGTERIKLSSRGDADMYEFFTANPSISKNILFIGETGISLDNTIYRINDPNNDFFFLQYTPASGKTFSNKLRVQHDSLMISRADFLFNGKEPADSEDVKLGFIQNYSAEKKVIEIVSFKPAFMSFNDCKNIMNTVKATLGNDREKVIEETMTQLYYNLGKPDKNTLGKIYDSL